MNDSKRKRGKGFPTLPLDDSRGVIQDAGKYGREHSIGAFSGYLGHSSTNSGAFLAKMAALNDWGLIDRDGERVTLSSLGERIAYPSSPEDEAIALRDAFFHSELFAAIYTDSAKAVELSLDVIGNRAVTGLGVAGQRKAQFAQSFARSAVVAGLARGGANGSSVVLLSPDAEPTPPAEEDGNIRETATTQPATGTGSGATDPPTLHQEWPVANGTLIFEARLGSALPADAFRQLAEVTDSIGRLVELLGVPPEHDPDESDDAR